MEAPVPAVQLTAAQGPSCAARAEHGRSNQESPNPTVSESPLQGPDPVQNPSLVNRRGRGRAFPLPEAPALGAQLGTELAAGHVVKPLLIHTEDTNTVLLERHSLDSRDLRTSPSWPESRGKDPPPFGGPGWTTSSSTPSRGRGTGRSLRAR